MVDASPTTSRGRNLCGLANATQGFVANCAIDFVPNAPRIAQGMEHATGQLVIAKPGLAGMIALSSLPKVA